MRAIGKPGNDDDNWLRFIAQNASEIVVVVDPDGTLRYASPSFGRILGYDPGGAPGKNMFDLAHPDDVPWVLEETGWGASGDAPGAPSGPAAVEYRFRHKDGSWRWMEAWVTDRQDDPAVGGIVVNARDVTERKGAEERLREAEERYRTLVEQMERRVAERTAQLEGYAARLAASNRELQDFAHVASHDLQEPLRKVSSFSKRLRTSCADVLDERGLEYLARMEDAAGRMKGLIEDLLALSQVTTLGRPFVPVDLGEVVRGVISDLEATLEESGGRVEVGEMPTIDADRPQMRQLFQNLIGNALKFRRPGEAPMVRVRARVLPERRDGARSGGAPGGELCCITVEDNGIGFDEQYLGRIFAPFERLHGRGSYEGTGMGLAICRKVVERHGGEMSAKGLPGQGATFIVTLSVGQP